MAPTGEVIQSVFRIRSLKGEGTAFAVSFESRQYLVTAAHVLFADDSRPSLSSIFPLEVFHADTWKPLECRVVGCGEDPSDIAVLAPPQVLASYNLKLGTDSLVYGQEVFFLGFPYSMHGKIGKMNNDFPMPYVKRAIVSMINFIGQQQLVLDGHNNAGFSGGPVVFQPVGRQNTGWQIAAVVEGFSSARSPVYETATEQETSLYVEENTGLISACPMDVGLQLIRANPIGFPMQASGNEIT